LRSRPSSLWCLAAKGRKSLPLPFVYKHPFPVLRRTRLIYFTRGSSFFVLHSCSVVYLTASDQMKFLNLKRPHGQNNLDMMDSSRATTAVPSPDQSSHNLEKDYLASRTSPAASTTQSMHGEKRVIETTPIEEAAALDKLSDEPEYPSGIKLFIITIALCLSVFLVALVSTRLASSKPTTNLWIPTSLH